jgi:hypothetical protein
MEHEKNYCNIYNTMKHSNAEITWKNNVCNIEIQNPQHLRNDTLSMTHLGSCREHQSGALLAIGARPRGSGGSTTGTVVL